MVRPDITLRAYWALKPRSYLSNYVDNHFSVISNDCFLSVVSRRSLLPLLFCDCYAAVNKAKLTEITMQ